MVTKSLLPPNATSQELALESAMSRISDIPVPIRSIWNPNTCPSDFLPWLAWSFGVDVWDSAWSDDEKRTTIRDAIMIHKRKGTPWAIKRISALLGLGEVDIDEGRDGYRRNGKFHRQPFFVRGDHAHWAEYRVVAQSPITLQRIALAEKIIPSIAPARCRLIEVSYPYTALVRNGFAKRDGSYARCLHPPGTAETQPAKRLNTWCAPAVPVRNGGMIRNGGWSRGSIDTHHAGAFVRNGFVKRDGSYTRGVIYYGSPVAVQNQLPLIRGSGLIRGDGHVRG